MEYLFSAYFIIWLLLLVYMFGLNKKQKNIAKDIEELKDRIG
jgi:CcmD family protein